jgi:hypothetical protein
MKKRKETKWFRSAVRSNYGDVLLEGQVKIVKVEPFTDADTMSLLVSFDNDETLITNAAFLRSRDTMERWCAESREAWLSGPTDRAEWASYVDGLLGLDNNATTVPNIESPPPPPLPPSPPAEVCMDETGAYVAIAYPYHP